MRDWPSQHRNLAALVFFVLLAAVAVFLFVLHPQANEVKDLQSQRADLQKKLNETGWPADSEKLEHLLKDYQRTLDGVKSRDPGARRIVGIKEQSDTILKSATSMFQGKIENDYVSSAYFMNEASQLDYQEEYNQLEQWLRGKGIILSGKTFGMTEDTADVDNTYQLLLKLWTVDSLTKLALKHELMFAKDRHVVVPTAMGPNVRPSMITVLPVQAYVLDEEDKEPYVLEFPVRMTMRGSIDNLCGFLRELHADGNFYPVSRLELNTESPLGRHGKPDREGRISIQGIEVTVVCSSFFRPQENAPKMKVKKEKKAPRGA